MKPLPFAAERDRRRQWPQLADHQDERVYMVIGLGAGEPQSELPPDLTQYDRGARWAGQIRRCLGIVAEAIGVLIFVACMCGGVWALGDLIWSFGHG